MNAKSVIKALDDLEAEKKAAIDQQAFEYAAQVCDEIRALKQSQPEVQQGESNRRQCPCGHPITTKVNLCDLCFETELALRKWVQPKPSLKSQLDEARQLLINKGSELQKLKSQLEALVGELEKEAELRSGFTSAQGYNFSANRLRELLKNV